MRGSDVPAVVEIHLASFQGFFLSFLGDRFLRLYYESICDFRQLRLVACNDSGIVGFVVGIDDSFGFYQSLLKYRLHRFAIATAPVLLRNPRVAPRLLRALTKRSRHEGEKGNSATLTSIAVHPDAQSRGVGYALVQRFIEEATDRGVERIYLETDAVGNEAVCNFYERAGFVIFREYATSEDREMREYLLEITRKR